MRTFHCPPDKSISHRALIFAALAQSPSKISSLSAGGDVATTRCVLERLGCEFRQLSSEQAAMDLEVSPPEGGLFSSLLLRHSLSRNSRGTESVASRTPPIELNFGNSGTTARLLIGLLAGVEGLVCRVDGDASLRKRPMGRVFKGLERLGFRVDGELSGTGFYLPFVLRGQSLRRASIASEAASAQLKSAWLLALLFAENQAGEEFEVSLPAHSRDHTEIMLRHLGVLLGTSEVGDRQKIFGSWAQPPVWQGFSESIPNDPSSAAFWALWAFLKQEEIFVPALCANPLRNAWLKVLEKMGFFYEFRNQTSGFFGESVADLWLKAPAPEALRGVDVSSDQIPSLIDELPLLAVLASFAVGESVFRGCAELRIKESDRLERVIALIRAMGGQARAQGTEQEDLWVGGRIAFDGGVSHSAVFDAAKDHRLAMIGHLLKSCWSADLQLLGADAEDIAISYPVFLSELDSAE